MRQEKAVIKSIKSETASHMGEYVVVDKARISVRHTTCSILVLVIAPILLLNPNQIQEVVILILIVALSSVLVLILTRLLRQVEFVKYVRLLKI